ncbi:[Fe-S]-binding protein, partial [Thermus scotoductus]
MLTLPEKILFILLLLASLYYAYTGFRRVYLAIRRGRPEERFDRLPERIGRALWLTLTQQTVFKRRPLVSLLHAFVFYGFVYYLLVNLVDLLEGYFPLHTQGGLWNAYNLVADLLTAAILVGILGLMLRRYLLAPQDFTWNPKVPLHERVRQGIPRDSAIVG